MIYLSFTQPAVVFAVGEIMLFDCPQTFCPRASFTLKDKSKIQKSINYQLIVFADLFFLSNPEVFFKLNLGWLLKRLENWLLKTLEVLPGIVLRNPPILGRNTISQYATEALFRLHST